MTQIKIFEADSAAKLEKKVNKWSKEHPEEDPLSVDFKFQVMEIGDVEEDDTELLYTVLIAYGSNSEDD